LLASPGGRTLSSVLRVHAFGLIDLNNGLEKFTTSRQPAQDAAYFPDSVVSDQEASREDLLFQLQEAWRYFESKNGHVSKWYFENRWKPSGPCPSPGTHRQQFLDELISQGQVEVFETVVNGRVVYALRPG